jgi:hypothetical protein
LFLLIIIISGECDAQIERRKQDKTLPGNFIFIQNEKVHLYYTEYKTIGYVYCFFCKLTIIIIIMSRKYGVIVRILDEQCSKYFQVFFHWIKLTFTIPTFYNSYIFRNISGTPCVRPGKLVTTAIKIWCGDKYETTVQNLRYSVATYAAKLKNKGIINEADLQLISEGKATKKKNN